MSENTEQMQTHIHGPDCDHEAQYDHDHDNPQHDHSHQHTHVHGPNCDHEPQHDHSHHEHDHNHDHHHHDHSHQHTHVHGPDCDHDHDNPQHDHSHQHTHVHGPNCNHGDGNEIDIEAFLMQWFHSLVSKEVKRLKEQNINAIPVPVKGMDTIPAGHVVLNRLEIDTNYDFTKITQIMVSDPIPCPFLPAYQYVHVLLFVNEKTPPIILPFFHQQQKNNQLTDWLFINAKGEQAQHIVKNFYKIENGEKDDKSEKSEKVEEKA